jgi:hypothetical protein
VKIKLVAYDEQGNPLDYGWVQIHEPNWGSPTVPSDIFTAAIREASLLEHFTATDPEDLDGQEIASDRLKTVGPDDLDDEPAAAAGLV